MAFDSTTAIRVLTMTSLGGLLFTTGLRLTLRQMADSVRCNRLGWILPVNFLLIPAMTFAAAWLFQLPSAIAIGMLLLGAAPFAPVVPIFTKMARADLALAGVLTAVFPFFAAFLTPIVCEFTLKPWLGTESLKFNLLTILGVLLATITLPMAIGVGFNHWLPNAGRKLVRPFEIISEAAGAISLAYVSVIEFPTIRSVGWKPLAVMAVLSELSLLVGYAIGGPSTGARRVVALGTANRNIALALLVAIESFPDTPIVAAVVANGLLLIFLGLLHVAIWRFSSHKIE